MLPPMVPRLRTWTSPTSAGGVGQQGGVQPDARIGGDVVVGGGGTDAHGVGFFVDAAEFRDALEIDDVLRGGEAKGHHRHQCHAAGQGPRAVRVGGQQTQGVGQPGR